MKLGSIDYFELKVQFQLMIDLGGLQGAVTDSIKAIRNANQSTAKTVVDNILSLGRELALSTSGELTL